jgi:hypothetical protein
MTADSWQRAAGASREYTTGRRHLGAGAVDDLVQFRVVPMLEVRGHTSEPFVSNFDASYITPTLKVSPIPRFDDVLVHALVDDDRGGSSCLLRQERSAAFPTWTNGSGDKVLG